MQCRFQAGDRVVFVREVDTKTPAPKEAIQAMKKYGFVVGSIYTVASVSMPDLPGEPGLRFNEVPRFIVYSTAHGREVEIIWDHRCFEPVKSVDFWIGEEAANRLKSGRGLEIQEHSDDHRRGKVRLPQGGGSLD